MFEKIEVLDREKHLALRFTRTQGFNFARKVAAVPLGASELLIASRYYPIIIPEKDGCLPQALFSITKNHNAFVDKSGDWLVPYIPAHIRSYPFLLAPVEKDNANSPDPATPPKYALCIDRAAAHFQSDTGDRIFTETGKPSAVTNKITEFLNNYQLDLQTGEVFFKLLQEKNCLVTRELKSSLNDKNVALGAFRTVDLEKIKALDDATLADWLRKGLSNLIQAQIQSLDNLKKFTLQTVTDPESLS